MTAAVPKRVLFVCVENSCRSQMAEAFVCMAARSGVEAFSAGSHASGTVNPRAIRFMAELGYDLSVHRSKSLDEYRAVRFDAVIGMGCGDACPAVAAAIREDWQLSDPKNLTDEQFRATRDEIGLRVRQLLDRM